MNEFRIIKKRNGNIEPLIQRSQIKWAEWARRLVLDWSSVVLEFVVNAMTVVVQQIYNAMIAAVWIKKPHNILKMVGRLYIGALIKETFGD